MLLYVSAAGAASELLSDLPAPGSPGIAGIMPSGIGSADKSGS